MCENSENSASKSSSTNDTNLVWQQWTATFRASRRLKNDLIAEEGIDANVERHMTLMPNKKRSLFDDDDSDSDDESNYYKLDVPPPQQQQLRHPLEFTPSGFLPRLGVQQVTPVSCDPVALPVCSLRRYGHDDDGCGSYDAEERIPPPPSFHRYPSKKRAVGLARPEPEQDFYNRGGPSATATTTGSTGTPKFSMSMSEPQQDECAPPPPPSTALSRPAVFSTGIFNNNLESNSVTTTEAFPPPPTSSINNNNKSQMDMLAEEDNDEAPLPPALSLTRATVTGLPRFPAPSTTKENLPENNGETPIPPVTIFPAKDHSKKGFEKFERDTLIGVTAGIDSQIMAAPPPRPPQA